MTLSIALLFSATFPAIVGKRKFNSWGRCTMAIIKIRLDIQCFLWPVYDTKQMFYARFQSCKLG